MLERKPEDVIQLPGAPLLVSASGPYVASRWYAAMLGEPFVAADSVVERGLSPRALRMVHKAPLLWALLLLRRTRRAETIGLIYKDPGVLSFLLLNALTPRPRRVRLLEFLPRTTPSRRLPRLLYRLRWRLVDTRLLRRGIDSVQALSADEVGTYAREYRLGNGRVRYIPWALTRKRRPLPPVVDTGPVLASGRALCDWATLFDAARGRDWNLQVVCSDVDRPYVDELNRDGLAEVRSEIPREVHDGLLRKAAVYVVVLREAEPSAGHVRLMAAVENGAPTVATDTPGLEQYVVDRETALLVPLGDAEALREAVDLLLADPELRRRLRETAHARAQERPYAVYFDEVRDFLAVDGT